MSVAYGKFEMPKHVTFDKETATRTFTRFTAEPFERGFGHTVGNALRRIMLSSLEAPAIIAIWLEGVPHEYMAIEGIVEDMTNIILNFKGALLRKLPASADERMVSSIMLSKVIEVKQEDLKKHGQVAIRLGDVIDDGQFDVVNPDLVLFSVTKPMKRRLEMRVAFGRGYVPSERHNILDKKVDEITIDSAFSSVRLVNYFVENTRVGQDTDFDRLILEVTTDGRVSPQEALAFAAQIGTKHFEVFEKISLQELLLEEGENKSNTDRESLLQKLALRIDEIELSVRSTNCLNAAGIQTIGELVVMREVEMLQYRNFGKKSLLEIKAKLTQMGLGFGMDLSRYGINRDNVKEVVSVYMQERPSPDLEVEVG